MSVLDAQIDLLDRCTAPELRGTVKEVRGLALRVSALPAPIGAMVEIFPRAVQQNHSTAIPGRSMPPT